MTHSLPNGGVRTHDTSAERVQAKELVMDLWGRGFSASQVADRVNIKFFGLLRAPLTRNAVIGIVQRHRLRLLREGQNPEYKVPTERRGKVTLRAHPTRAEKLQMATKTEIPEGTPRVKQELHGVRQRVEFAEAYPVFGKGEIDDAGRKHNVPLAEVDDRGCREITDGLYCNAITCITQRGTRSSYCRQHESGKRQAAWAKPRIPFKPIRRNM
jgi:hypothetical protein